MLDKFQTIDEEEELTSPQKRLRHWIQTRFPSITTFARAIGSTPAGVQPYLREGGCLYGQAYRRKLKSLGLNLNWYLTGKSLDDNATEDSSTDVKFAFQAFEGFQTVKKEDRTTTLFTDTIDGVQRYADANNYDFNFAIEKLIVDRLSQIMS